MEKNKTMPKGSNCNAKTSPLLTRRLSNPSICRLIAESVANPLSPMTQSPAGSGELRSILQRLELMEMESRDLLQRLFSMVQTDARLERYIRKRLQDPKVSRIWELVEQILASQQGRLDIERMLNDNGDSSDDNNNGVSDYNGGDFPPSAPLLTSVDKGVKVTDDGIRMERFKVRHFDMGEVVVAQPHLQTRKK